MTRAALALCLLAGCGPAERPPVEDPAGYDGETVADADDTPSEGRAVTPAERRAIDRLFHTAERIRGLRFRRPVNVEILDRETITRHLTDDLEEEDIETSRLVYTALGLLRPEIDVRELLTRVLSEQVVGFYDPEDRRLVVRDDVARELGGSVTLGARPSEEAGLVLVHEMVHALQDQQLGLGETHDDDRDSDADHAYRGLIEGDATLAMLGYVVETLGRSLRDITQDPDFLQAMIGGAAAGGQVPDEELGSAPAILRETLVGAYVYGVGFCAELYRREGWEAVNSAHRTLPASSEQVMHPARYFQRDAPVPVTIPELPAIEQAGYSELDEDTLGELEIGVYFGQLTDAVDPIAATGWGGDRLRAYRRSGGEVAIVWFTAWDNEREAEEAQAAGLRVLEAVPADARPRHVVEKYGRAVLIVRGLDPALHAPVREAFTAFATTLR